MRWHCAQRTARFLVPMYELSHDLIGALSPMIVVLAMVMMTGGAGGSSSYVLVFR